MQSCFDFRSASSLNPKPCKHMCPAWWFQGMWPSCNLVLRRLLQKDGADLSHACCASVYAGSSKYKRGWCVKALQGDLLPETRCWNMQSCSSEPKVSSKLCYPVSTCAVEGIKWGFIVQQQGYRKLIVFNNIQRLPTSWTANSGACAMLALWVHPPTNSARQEDDRYFQTRENKLINSPVCKEDWVQNELLWFRTLFW